MSDSLKILPEGAKSRGAKFGPSGMSLRSHESVLVQYHKPLDVPAIVSRARDGDKGGPWLADHIRDLGIRRMNAARARKAGEVVNDPEAEALSFAHLKNGGDLARALDFDVTIKTPTSSGSERAITTAAFALLTGSMAVADVNVAYEMVPTVVERLVQDIDDDSPHTEVAQLLDFGHADPKNPPKPLGETEEYHEAEAVDEDRYTILSFKDGYQRAFSQEVIERMPTRAFAQLTDLGQGAREIMEFQALRRLIDYDGSKGTGPTNYVMTRNRVGAALFSATANTPASRAPNGTRINNNPFTDGTSLSNLRVRLASMRNSRNYPIVNWPEKILIPDALWELAFTTLHSMLVPGEFNAMNFWGPGGPLGAIELISTPFLDVLQSTNSVSSWYGGRPQRQFLRKWKTRPEIAVHGGNGTEAFLRTREGMRVRIGWDMLVGARDYVYWVENLPVTTPPGGN